MGELLFSLERPTADEVADLRERVERAGGQATDVRASGSIGVQEAQLLIEAAGPALSGVATVLAAWIAARAAGRRPVDTGSTEDSAASRETDRQPLDDRQVVLLTPDGYEVRCDVDHLEPVGAALQSLTTKPPSQQGE